PGGIEPQGNVVLKPAQFTVETLEAGVGEVLVYVEDPEGHTEEAKVVPNNDKKRTYSVTYVPKVGGLHKVTVLFAGQNIDKSPFGVNVGMALGDATKVTARGPGLEPVGNVANKPTYFDIYTAGAGPGDVGVVIVDPQGRRDTVEVMLEDKGDNIYRCTYRPVLEGPHTVCVTYAGAQVPKSPFTVNVAEACTPSACRATGRGLQPKGVRVQETADFKVLTKGAGTGELRVLVKGPKGTEEPVKVRDVGDGVYECEYHPMVPGKYQVAITWGGYAIPRSPFEVQVAPEAGAQKVRAWGPGLEGGVVGKSADFVVEAIGTEVGTLGEWGHWGDTGGTWGHWCGERGLGEAAVKAFGPGLEPSGCIVERPAEFTIDTRGAGKGPLKLYAQDAEGFPIDIKVKDNGDGTFHCVYVPTKAIKHTIIVTWGGVTTPRSPFRVLVGEGSHPGRVKVYGPGVEKTGLKANEPTYFTVDCSEAGQGDVSIGIKCAPGVVGPVEADIDFDIIKNDNDTFTVKYTPPGAGLYTIMVLFANQEIPSSPFRIKVEPSHDASKVKAEGPGLSRTGEGQGDGGAETLGAVGLGTLGAVGMGAVGIGACGAETVGAVGQEPWVLWGWEGPYRVEVTYDGHPLPGSPFPVEAQLPPDPAKVCAYGPGLQGGRVGVPAPFTIDTKGAGTGGLGLTVEGPCEAKIECQDNGDGSCAVSYLPTAPGDYNINILFAERHIPGSPFKAKVTPVFDPTKVTASGPGLERGKAGEVATFMVDCSEAGEAELTIEIISEAGVKAEVSLHNNRDGTYTITYTPACAGAYTITIKYGGHPVPKFPVRVTVDPAVDTSGVKVYGKGVEPRGEEGGGHLGGNHRGLLLPVGTTVASPPPYHGGDTSHPPTTRVPSPSPRGTHRSHATPSPRAVPERWCPVPRGAGTGGLGLAIEGPSEAKMSCKDNKDGSCTVEYIPFTPGDYDVNITFGGHPIPGMWGAGGGGVGGGVGVSWGPTSGAVGWAPPIVLPPTQRGAEPPPPLWDADPPPRFCAPQDPEGHPKKASIRDNGDGTYAVSYVPDVPGRYTSTVKYGGDEIPRSPFRTLAVPAGDASKCLVTGGPCACLGPTIQIGEETVITVDAKAAGQGKVTCKVSTPDGAELDVDVVENHDGTFDIYYTAPEPGKYVITIRFGGEHVPNSPFHVLVGRDHRYGGARGCVCVGGCCGARVCPTLPPPHCPADAVPPGEVRMPSGKTARPNITDNKDGTVTVRYAPTEKGLHEMDIRYDGNHIPGSPLQFYVDAINPRHVSAYGPGLSHGMVNKPCTFTIVTKDAGEGGLSLAVEGPSKAEITCQDNKDGTCTVSYLPTAPGDYNIIVRFDDKHIPGSPFTAKITGDDSMRTSQLNVGTSTDVSLKITETDLSLLTASIRAPSGNEEPCLLKRLPNRHIGISFTPKEVGEHVVSVRKSGQHVTNSPFKILVGQSEIGDASRVKVWGQGLVEGHTFEVAEFIVDTRSAGYGGLGLSIEGPSKVDINCEDVEDGTCKVTYCPTEPGNYIINIKFADKHVPGGLGGTHTVGWHRGGLPWVLSWWPGP
uniref:Filamin C n=1 Tax=Otus sunia TaxID=257818 RepID=A0A8C8E777_9STRI